MHSGNRIVAARPLFCAVAAFFTFTGCASMHAAEARKQYLLRELNAYEYQQDIDTVWLAALKLLAERGFPLRGKDRKAAEQDASSLVGSIIGEDNLVGDMFNKGRETVIFKDGSRVALTDWRPVYERDRTRYRVDGFATSPNSCRIRFSSAEWSKQDVLREPDTRNRDVEMELDLMSLLDPEKAQQLAAGVEAAATGRAAQPTPEQIPEAIPPSDTTAEPTPTPEPTAEPTPAPEPAPSSPE